MTLSIPELRPALLERDLWYDLDDLRAFRDRCRHQYARPLDPKRVIAVQDLVERAVPRFLEAHAAFHGALDRIRAGLPLV